MSGTVLREMEKSRPKEIPFLNSNGLESKSTYKTSIETIKQGTNFNGHKITDTII